MPHETQFTSLKQKKSIRPTSTRAWARPIWRVPYMSFIFSKLSWWTTIRNRLTLQVAINLVAIKVKQVTHWIFQIVEKFYCHVKENIKHSITTLHIVSCDNVSTWRHFFFLWYTYLSTDMIHIIIRHTNTTMFIRALTEQHSNCGTFRVPFILG